MPAQSSPENHKPFSWRGVYIALKAAARVGEFDVEFVEACGLPVQLAHERPPGEMPAKSERRNKKLAFRRAEAARRKLARMHDAQLIKEGEE